MDKSRKEQVVVSDHTSAGCAVLLVLMGTFMCIVTWAVGMWAMVTLVIKL